MGRFRMFRVGPCLVGWTVLVLRGCGLLLFNRVFCIGLWFVLDSKVLDGVPSLVDGDFR